MSADDEKFELVVVNPGYMLGPVLKGTACTSMEVCTVVPQLSRFLDYPDLLFWSHFS